MNRAFLEQLGLEIKESSGVVEAEFRMPPGLAVNPLTLRPIDRVCFTLMGERLLFVGPPEYVGGTPVNLAFANKTTNLCELLLQRLNDHLFQLERRSNELSALNVSPQVDGPSLQLTAEIVREPLRFIVGCNRTGQFRVLKAFHDDAELSTSAPTAFELSEFRDRKSLQDFLFAMYADGALTPYMSEHTPSPFVMPSTETSIPLRALVAAFQGAVLPPKSTIEIIAEIRVGRTQTLRFAASRIGGQTFRGLLAGPSGKLWADRFELSRFPGIRALVAKVMDVPVADVEVVSG
jgi:hypothetical protein